MGQNKKSNQGFVGRIWLSCSLEQKVRYIAGSAAIVVILSIAANLLVAGFGMKGFHTVLKNNSHALSFWSAMSGESSAFVALVRDRTEENQKRFHEACLKSEAALITIRSGRSHMPGPGPFSICMKTMPGKGTGSWTWRRTMRGTWTGCIPSTASRDIWKTMQDAWNR